MSDSNNYPSQPPILGPDDLAAAFNVSRETIARLATYEDLLRQWQKAVNLVAPSTLNAIWHRHFADSAQLLLLAPTASCWVDLGSGAGFPGMVVAILLADRGITPTPDPSPRRVEDAPSARWGGEPPARGAPRITLIESNARKCAFLREVVRQTGIGARVSVDILSTRIETAATQASLPAPDVVSARALAPLDKLLGLAAPLFTPVTVGLFLKGRDAAAELEAAKKAWNFNAELVPSRTDRDGRIIVVRNLVPKSGGMKS
jgi:16S rRNA (guanine527-N7)-methyltransferase